MDDISRAVQEMYDEAGGYFSKTREKKYGKNANWPETQQVLAKLTAGQVVLDVGCGDGRLISGLPKGVNYLGIDFSKTLLTIAKKKYPDHEFRQGDIANKSSWQKLDRYDLVACVATLHHVPTRKHQLFVLKKMREVTKAGGRCYLTVWNLWNARMIERKLKKNRLVSGKMEKMSFGTTPGRYVMAMDLPYMVKLMEESGWRIEEVFYADRDGKKTEIRQGKNLVVLASK